MSIRAWRIGAVLIVGAGLILQSPWLFALGVTIAVTGVISKAWAAASLHRVTYSRQLGSRRVFPDEPVALRLQLFNGKLLPVARVEAVDALDRHLMVTGEALLSGARSERREFTHATALLPYERITYSYELHAPRGIHSLGPVTLRGGDLFGLYDSRREAHDYDTLIVYPRPADISGAGLPAAVRQPEMPRQRALLRDPSRPVGIREMRPEDERRTVHWKASARLGKLVVKVPEPVGKPTVVVIVNAATFESLHIGVDRALQELVISSAAGVVRAAVEAGMAVGLSVNSGARGQGRSIRVEPRAGKKHLRPLLEALAAVTAFVTVTPERLVMDEARRAPPGATLVVVSSLSTPHLLAALRRARRGGRGVSFIHVGEDGQPAEWSRGRPRRSTSRAAAHAGVNGDDAGILESDIGTGTLTRR